MLELFIFSVLLIGYILLSYLSADFNIIRVIAFMDTIYDKKSDIHALKLITLVRNKKLHATIGKYNIVFFKLVSNDYEHMGDDNKLLDITPSHPGNYGKAWEYFGRGVGRISLKTYKLLRILEKELKEKPENKLRKQQHLE